MTQTTTNYRDQLTDDLVDPFELGRLQGFKEALNRIDRYANCIGGQLGVSCKWFAKNCQEFIPDIGKGEVEK
jgi:hypothetical protein